MRSSGPSPCSSRQLDTAFRQATWLEFAPFSTFRDQNAAIGPNWRLARLLRYLLCLMLDLAMSWSGRETDNNKVARLLPRPPSTTTQKRPKSATPLPDQHPLTNGAKAHFEAGRLSYEGDYLKPAKKVLIDLAVSKTGLDKALSFAMPLFVVRRQRSPCSYRPKGGAFLQSRSRRARSTWEKPQIQQFMVPLALYSGIYRHRGNRPDDYRNVGGSGGPLRQR